eukprot:scaffold1521_cov271-Chaetoceros_neogracile.AAC.69
MEMGLMEGFTASATDDDEAYYDALHEDDYTIQDQMCDPIAFMGKKGDKDTLYYHQAMAAPDKINFQEAMIKEFIDHTEKHQGMVITIENELLHNELEECKFFILQHLDQCDAPLLDGSDDQHKKIMSFVTSDGMTQNSHCRTNVKDSGRLPRSPSGKKICVVSCIGSLAQSRAYHRVSCLRVRLHRDVKGNPGPVIWDSGASVCVEPTKENFHCYTKDVDIKNLQSFTKSGTPVVGMGKVTHYIKDVDGNLRTLQLKTYHVPSSKHRIIATSEVLRQYEGETFSEDNNGLTLSGMINNKFRRPIFAPCNKSSSLLVSITHHYGKNTTYFDPDPESRTHQHRMDVSEEEDNKVIAKFHKIFKNGIYFLDLSSINISTVSNDNINLAPAEKELLRWHCRLAHISFAKVQHLMRAGSLANTEATRRLHCVACNLPPVKCSACLFAKQRTRSSPGTKHSTVKDKVGALRNNDLHPGQKVSLDHFVCSTNGRLFSSRGKTAEKNTYSGGALFVDHASSYIHPEFQTVLSSHATIIAKTSFEGMCRDHGVIPQKNLTDNATAFTLRNASARVLFLVARCSFLVYSSNAAS